MASKKASGFVTEEQRHTERINLRLGTLAMARLEAFSEEHGWTFAKTVTEALGALARELAAEQAHNDAIDGGATPGEARAVFADVYLTALRERERMSTVLRSTE